MHNKGYYIRILFLLSFVFACQQDDQEGGVDIVQDDLLETVSVSEVEDFFGPDKKLGKNSEQGLNIVPHLDQLRQDDITGSQAKLTVVPASTKYKGLESSVLFLKIDGELKKVLMTRMPNRIAATTPEYTGDLVFTKLDGELLIILQMQDGVTRRAYRNSNLATNGKHRSAAKTGRNDDDCDEDLLPGEFCSGIQLDEVTVTANGNNDPNHVPIVTILYDPNNYFGDYDINGGSPTGEDGDGEWEVPPNTDPDEKDWYLDNDGDGYHSAHIRTVELPSAYSGGNWGRLTHGPDCDDTNPEVHKLNTCGECKKENECDDPCKNKDLTNKKVSDNVKNQIDQRMQGVSVPGGSVAANVKSFEIQTIEDGTSDINLDRYSLEINSLPDGYTPQQLFEEIRTNFYDLVTGGDYFWEKAEFMSYAAQDTNSWGSSNPVGSAMDFDTLMDTATVICTEYSQSEMYWIFTTVHSVDHLGHPVSGHRRFGIEDNGDGSYSFVVRGADRLTTWVDSAANVTLGLGGDFAFDLADRTWKNLMETIEKYINDKPGGNAESFDKNKEYGKRYEYNEGDCPE
ncbi:hypothetical protein [Maribacter sp. 2304DJ31-5]|uniref:hypothetical protein n=1 Tax=Maribacter sp. 2304DJ31-5 TaxID=3386273 RepID=UPI0039BD0233